MGTCPDLEGLLFPWPNVKILMFWNDGFRCLFWSPSNQKMAWETRATTWQPAIHSWQLKCFPSHTDRYDFYFSFIFILTRTEELHFFHRLLDKKFLSHFQLCFQNVRRGSLKSVILQNTCWDCSALSCRLLKFLAWGYRWTWSVPVGFVWVMGSTDQRPGTQR